jgi:hypothetical protein
LQGAVVAVEGSVSMSNDDAEIPKISFQQEAKKREGEQKQDYFWPHGRLTIVR